MYFQKLQNLTQNIFSASFLLTARKPQVTSISSDYPILGTQDKEPVSSLTLKAEEKEHKKFESRSTYKFRSLLPEVKREKQ